MVLSYSQRMQPLAEEGWDREEVHRWRGDPRGLRKRTMKCWHRQSSGGGMGTDDRAKGDGKSQGKPTTLRITKKASEEGREKGKNIG